MDVFPFATSNLLLLNVMLIMLHSWCLGSASCSKLIFHLETFNVRSEKTTNTSMKVFVCSVRACKSHKKQL